MGTVSINYTFITSGYPDYKAIISADMLLKLDQSPDYYPLGPPATIDLGISPVTNESYKCNGLDITVNGNPTINFTTVPIQTFNQISRDNTTINWTVSNNVMLKNSVAQNRLYVIIGLNNQNPYGADPRPYSISFQQSSGTVFCTSGSLPYYQNIEIETRFGPGNNALADFTIFTTFDVLCVREDALVHTTAPEGLMRIKDLVGRNDITLINHMGKEVKLLQCVYMNKSDQFVLFKQNSLGENIPSSDLYITPWHPVYFNGSAVEAKHLVNNDTIIWLTTEPEDIYTLVTEELDHVLINNVPVTTWEKDNLLREIKKRVMDAIAINEL